MNRRTAILLGVLAVLLMALGGYLASRAEPYEDVIKHGPSPEARANRFLAAELFLRQQGRPVQRTEGLEVLDALPSQGQSLLLLADRGHMTLRQAERLLAWTERGGHLLIVAERLWDQEKGASGDLLLDRLGIQQFDSSQLQDEPQAQAQQPSRSTRGRKPSARSDAAVAASSERYPELTKLYLENEDAPAYFAFDTRFHLYDSENRAHAWANSAKATHMLQLYHGDGLITVLTDPWLWQNAHIADYDNAWLLWYLTQDTSVTLLHRAEGDDLFTLLLRYFPEALCALALLLALLLWHQGQRQEPLVPSAQPARRQLQEHLRGSADFLLRHAGQHSLLQALQEDIRRRARRRHPGFERLPVAEQWQVLGRLARQPSRSIGQAMCPPAKQRQSAAQFTRQVAYLQTLRNVL